MVPVDLLNKTNWMYALNTPIWGYGIAPSTSRRIFFFWFVLPTNRYNIIMWYRMTRSFCRFLGHSTQTDCRSCSVDPKIHHHAKRSLAVYEHTGGVLRDFIVVIHRDICREHSLIGRRNRLMTDASCEFAISGRGPGIIDN